MSLPSHEIAHFNIENYLLYGGLPQVIMSKEPEKELNTYINTDLKQKIQAEVLTQNLQSFTRFLREAALTSGSMLNFSKISHDVGVPESTIREYYQILEDKQIGYVLPAWPKTQKRKPISTAKFYFFDVGVRNAISGIKIIHKDPDHYGQVFEHFIAMELRAYISYSRKKVKLSYWRSLLQHEVDFIIGDDIAIEIKSTGNVQSKHLKGLKILQQENICKKYFLVCRDSNYKFDNNIEIIHWENFLQKLWKNEIID